MISYEYQINSQHYGRHTSRRKISVIKANVSAATYCNFRSVVAFHTSVLVSLIHCNVSNISCRIPHVCCMASRNCCRVLPLIYYKVSLRDLLQGSTIG